MARRAPSGSISRRRDFDPLLRLRPERDGRFEGRLTLGGQAVAQAAAVGRDRLDPALVDEDPQVADEGRALEAQPLGEGGLGDRRAVPDGAQDPELGQLQPDRPEGGVVDAAEQAGGHPRMKGEAGLADGFEVGHGRDCRLRAPPVNRPGAAY